MRLLSLFYAKFSFPLLLFGLMTGCLLLSFLSIRYGVVSISAHDFTSFFTDFQQLNIAHQLLEEVRIPRLIGGLWVGLSLAVSGAILQAITRNELSDPSILGITQGASLAITIAIAATSLTSYWHLFFVSFLGSSVASLCLFLILFVWKISLDSTTLALAGTSFSILFSSIATGISIYFNFSQDLHFWFFGGLSGVKWEHLLPILFVAPVCFVLILFISRSVTLLSLNENTASSLGVNTVRTLILSFTCVVLLCGSAVVIGGSVTFIGLLLPFIAKKMVGNDFRKVLPISAIGGALLLTASDIAARFVAAPIETPLSAITTILGIPMFLYLSIRKDKHTHA
ncbi:MAG: FecCD family ABC transporter permease [Bacilli bacterium]